MEKSEVARLVGELKGAPASTVLAMLLLGRPMSLQELCTVTRYSAPTLRGAMNRLALLGFVQEERRVGQYVLTVQARQFILGETGLQLGESDQTQVREKNFFSLHDMDAKHHVLSPPEDPIILDVSEKIFLDDDAEAAVDLLIDKGRYERTKNGKGARDSVEAAIQGGWCGGECLACVEGWLECWESGQCDWIKDAGYVAWALREHRRPPSPKKDKKGCDPQAYISGEYGAYIQH